MNVPFLFEVIALIIALLVEFRAQGRDWLGWAVVLLCAALLWGRLG